MMYDCSSCLITFYTLLFCINFIAYVQKSFFLTKSLYSMLHAYTCELYSYQIGTIYLNYIIGPS